ncbi:patatin-like phospholipase family protein [Luminiphilus sp. nBUS_16]|uniref:patatin-like phospholipase family protein n=1 Tax=Luminiphilus sp. nBUS_16 TaxID=3395315 RepID=UPI003EBC46F4
MSDKSLSLILGSGGARGMAHVGVIRWLEEHDYKIASISGCSMGALVGGIYACGKLAEFTDWLRALDKLDIVKLLDVTLSDGGFVKGDRIIETLKELVGNHRIEELPITFTAVAANIEDEKEVWLNRGPVFDAIRASISLPLFFTPAQLGEQRLLDGGILNPVPIAPTFNDATSLKLAVNLNGKPLAYAQPVKEAAVEGQNGLREKVQTYIEDLARRSVSKVDIDMDMFDIANQTFDAMQGAIARHKLAIYPPDVVVEIPRNACGTLEFDRAEEMVELGYESAERALGSLS